MSDLSNKTALVTGGARGIGLAIGQKMLESGARVVLADIDLDEAESAAARLGEQASAMRLDVSDVDQCLAAVERVISSHGQLSILVNNAGICPLRPLPEVDRDFFDRLIGANLRGAFFLSQAAAAHMRSSHQGRIINIGSVGAKTGGYMDISVYCMTKAALASMTRSFAKYLAPHATVNTIAPGTIDTALTSAWNAPDMLEEIRKTIPMTRLGRPGDIAAAAAFLASDEAGFITGATMDVNGGMRMD